MRRIILLLTLLLSLTSQAQETNLSPYSRFGIGDIESGSFIPQFGLAGGSVARFDILHFNPLNPAASAHLKNPVFAFGVKTEQLEVRSLDATSTNSTTRLDHFSVAFPMYDGKWGAGFGLSPYTSIGYDDRNIIESEDGIEYTNAYTGSGGINRIFFDLSRKMIIGTDTSRYGQNNTLSIGAGMDYLFGTIRQERSSIFPNGEGFINTRIDDATTVNDVSLRGGIGYRTYLDRKVSKTDDRWMVLAIGATYEGAANLNSKRTRDAYSYTSNSSGVEQRKDSLASFSKQRGVISLPDGLRFGFALEIYGLNDDRDAQRKVTLSADYRTKDWSLSNEDFGTETTFSQLGQANGFNLGLSYVPNMSTSPGSRGRLFQVATYRLGARMGDSHLRLGDQAIEDRGISFGMSLPLLVGGIKTTDTQFDLGVEYSQRGEATINTLQEDYLRVMIGFSFHPDGFYDKWFRKRKYD